MKLLETGRKYVCGVDLSNSEGQDIKGMTIFEEENGVMKVVYPIINLKKLDIHNKFIKKAQKT